MARLADQEGGSENCYRLNREKMRKRKNDIPAVREFNVIVERDADGWYVASVPELHGCHTQAKSLDTLMKRIREAIELCLEVEDLERPSQFIGIQRVGIER
jgi:predicted RNase H-like HicB family nuclease